jgi:hypothetical protein
VATDVDHRGAGHCGINHRRDHQKAGHGKC